MSEREHEIREETDFWGNKHEYIYENGDRIGEVLNEERGGFFGFGTETVRVERDLKGEEVSYSRPEERGGFFGFGAETVDVKYSPNDEEVSTSKVEDRGGFFGFGAERIRVERSPESGDEISQTKWEDRGGFFGLFTERRRVTRFQDDLQQRDSPTTSRSTNSPGSGANSSRPGRSTEKGIGGGVIGLVVLGIIIVGLASLSTRSDEPSTLAEKGQKAEQSHASPIVQAATPLPLSKPLAIYRTRLSERDHFSSKGVDLRKIPEIKPADILLQDRLNVHVLRSGDAEDQYDTAFGRFSRQAYRALFEENLLQVLPPEGAAVIVHGTPLVEVTMRSDGMVARILDERPSQLSSEEPSPVPSRAKKKFHAEERVVYKVPDLKNLAGRNIKDAWLEGDFSIVAWTSHGARLRSRFETQDIGLSVFVNGDRKTLLGKTIVNVLFSKSAENLREGNTITFPRSSPLRVIGILRKDGWMLVTAEY